ncbi:hypothetical protein NOR51B_2729 [Luminiphilus syltensis NOR5-1B]|uniref:Uncharacterized protein n=1 Tax=Luminiphilus syltensis NOR5-1B TaxID=565045 RepID=B8KT56_9GAMM|nr:hypothetical protein NOR51B_2729 [Luminiphilus syltensis NOR5-1B]
MATRLLLFKTVDQRKNASCDSQSLPPRRASLTDIPHTRSGKIAEMALRKMIAGTPHGNRDALSNTEILQQFDGV